MRGIHLIRHLIRDPLPALGYQMRSWLAGDAAEAAVESEEAFCIWDPAARRMACEEKKL